MPQSGSPQTRECRQGPHSIEDSRSRVDGLKLAGGVRMLSWSGALLGRSGRDWRVRLRASATMGASVRSRGRGAGGRFRSAGSSVPTLPPTCSPILTPITCANWSTIELAERTRHASPHPMRRLPGLPALRKHPAH